MFCFILRRDPWSLLRQLVVWLIYEDHIMADAADQEAAANRFISEVWGLQGTAYIVVALRYYSRISTLGWSKLAWDDFIMLLAVVRDSIYLSYSANALLSLFLTTLCILACLHGRICHGVSSCGVLARLCEQRHDGRAKGRTRP